MRLIKRITLLLRSLLRRGRVEHELSAELQFHLDQQIEENLAAGMPPPEARASALRTIGGMAQIEEECRDARRVQWWENFARDLRYTLRNLRKAPVFAAVAVLSLALGTGANTAIFSLIDRVMLQELPVRDPQQLVVVRTSSQKVGMFDVSLTLTNNTLAELRRSTQLQGMATILDTERLNVGSDGATEVLPGAFVSGNLFQLMGVEPVLGRAISPRDDSREGAADGWPALISYRLWQRKFAGSPGVLGRRATVNTIPIVIVGVAPKSFRGLEIDSDSDLFLPSSARPQIESGKASAGFPGPDDFSGSVVGRLQPGATVQTAASELTVLFRQAMAAQHREKEMKRTIVLLPAARGQSWVRNRFHDGLTILMAVVAVVMLIAAANLASLMLARSTARQREICIRMSLGSGRGRLVRQLLTEALVISALGTGLGMVFASWSQSAVVRVALAHQFSGSLPFEWNGRLFAFAAGLCLLNALLFGLAPALRATRISASDVLHSGRTIGSPGVVRVGRWLIAGQIALSLALVAGAVLLLRTLNNLYSVDLGFNPRQVMMFSTDARLAGYDGERSLALYRDLLQRARSLPGAEAVSMIRNPMLGGEAGMTRVIVPGYVPTDAEKNAAPWTLDYPVGPQFFSTMRIPLVAGRDFTDEGIDRTGKVAIVNETMARHYFGTRSPIGEKIAAATETPDVEIIGVAADTHYFSPKEEKSDVIFTPLLQPNGSYVTYLVRTRGNPLQLAGDIRALVHSVDPNLPVYGIMSMGELLDDNLAQQRIIGTLSAFFAGLALVLSAIGLYGVLAYSVAQRTGEIGVRVALGATRGNIVRLVFRDTSAMLIVGVTAGVALSVASAKLIRTMLFGVSATDLASIVLAILILLAVALVASFVPTRRALRVDPMAALREE